MIHEPHEPHEYMPATKLADWLSVDSQTIKRWCDKWAVEYYAVPFNTKTTYLVHKAQFLEKMKANLKNPRPEKNPVGRPRLEVRV